MIHNNTHLNAGQILHGSQNINPEDFNVIDISPEKLMLFNGMLEMQQLYNAAIRKVSSSLEILDEEFKILHSRNPIHHLESRLKSPSSIMNKLIKNDCEVSVSSAMENLTDIAGIRVICQYINDVYSIAELLLKQEDVTIVKATDYITNPKPNGYRSLHLVVSVPIFLSEKTEHVPVEIQIRTIAMDFWASLEHPLRYKSYADVSEDLQRQLKECAEDIADIDLKMQDIYIQLNEM